MANANVKENANDTKHTPGPWRADRCNPAGNILVEVGDGYGKNMIATVWTDERPTGDANARLIAAAPELLAEAIELLRNAKYQDGQAIVLTQDCEALQAAIMKAEGR
jgi:hypothetical protein